MPSFSKPIKLFKGPFSFAVPKVPSVTSSSRNSQTTQSSPPNVHNFSPSPGKLVKMDFVDSPNLVTDTTLEEISKKQNEILSFLANAASNIEQVKYLDIDASTMSGRSTSTVSSTSSRSSKRCRSRNLRRKKNKLKWESEASPMQPVNEVLEETTGKGMPQSGFSGTAFTPTHILQPPKKPHSPTPSEANHRNQKQSFKEQLNMHFPAYIHPALEELGVSTVEQAYYLAIDDLISSPRINRVQARMIYALLQHHLIHKEYPAKISPNTPFMPNPSGVPIKAKYAKDLPSFSGRLCD